MITKDEIKYQFPKGTIYNITPPFTEEAVSLPYIHEPTVLISGSTTEGIAFEGSLDGKKYELIRDAEGDVIYRTKPGIYRIPAFVRYLRPAKGAGFDGTIQLFIEE